MKPKAFVAEFIGTFALVWVAIYVIRNFSDVPGGLLTMALAQGMAIAILVSATMAVSGGHLNPAVTLAMLMTRRINFMNAACYIVCQVAGGLAAAFAIRFAPLYKSASVYVFSSETVTLGTPKMTDMISITRLTDSQIAMTGLVLEAIATFFLVFAVFGTVVDKRAHKMGGIYIGMAVTMGILAIGPMTGAALNPARWIGPAMMGEISEFPMMQNAMVYIVGPVLGALVAALVYQYVLMDRDQMPAVDDAPPVE